MLSAQNLTGIWRGYFITGTGDQYKFEIQIKQTKNAVTGVSYSYLTTVFYGKATLTGNYNKTSKMALVQEIKTVELKMAGGVACIMKCNMEYIKSGKEEFLDGTYTSIFEKTDSVYGYVRGGDCGGGKVFLRKVPTSDFYIEPFLRKPTTTKTTPKPNNNTKTPATTNKNTTAKTNTTTNKTTTNKNTTAKTTTGSTTKNQAPKSNNLPKPDTTRKIDNTVTTVPKTTPSKPAITPPVLKDRSNELVKTINVKNEEITVKLYDNGEIDDDTISIYMNRKLVLSKKRLTAKPLTVKLKMDEENPEHDLVMVAENLGRIPPNTSLMIVEDGDKRYEVRITSTEQKNAMVRFRYQKDAP